MADDINVESPAASSLTNGHAEANPAKRKHEIETSSATIATARPPTETQQHDLLVILQRNEQYGKLLTREFREQSSNQRTKKAKLSSAATKSTSVSQKLEGARYTRWTDIVEDVDAVKEDWVKSIRDKKHTTDDRPSIAELKEIQLATASAAWVADIVTSEALGHPSDETAVKQEPEDTALDKSTEATSGTVLTLFGNAPTPRQLFSSLQSSNRAGGLTVVKNELKVEELSLPNGLSATKIKASTPISQKEPTFADSFPPPFALPQLTPPKSNKRTASKDNVVKWELRDTFAKSTKRGGYTTQKIPVADWLSYGGPGGRHDSLSPLEKLQRRDRALSSSKEDQPAKTDASFAAELEKQEEALFQQAYSSFAPAYDNSRSLVDASVKSMVWWNKVGSRQFDSRFAGQYELGARLPQALDEQTNKSEDDFARVVEEYEDEADPVEDEPDQSEVNTKLARIADLLQTLASYQWIRSAAPATSSSSRPSIATTPSISGIASKPDTPSEEEREVYDNLRDDIAQLVLQLPPYAVAKIDGDQLAELGVNSIISYNTANYKGQLEEDQVARTARFTAAATAASVASLTRSNVASNPHYSSTSRTPAIGQSANTRYGQSAGYGARSSLPSSAQRAGSYGTPTAPPRAQYAQPGQYARPGAPQTSYSQSGQQYRQSSSYGNYSTGFAQNTPQSQQRSSNYTAPFQLKSQAAAANAIAYQTSQYNNSSPGKSNATIGQQFAQQQANHGSPAHTPVAGLQQAPAPAPIVPRTNTPQQGSPAAVVNGHA